MKKVLKNNQEISFDDDNILNNDFEVNLNENINYDDLDFKEKCISKYKNSLNLNPKENFWNFEDEDEDEQLINFILSSKKKINKENELNESESNASDQTFEISEDSSNEYDNLENDYNGKPLIREQQLEKFFLKYAKPLLSKKNEKVALNLTKNINIEVGEGKYKNYVLINDKPFLISNRITRNLKKTIGLHLNESQFGFSYFCKYFDKRFNRICFQPFKCKKEVIDHYYSLHLQRLKNYFCNEENCKRAYTFYKQMKGHLINSHGITSKFEKYFTRLSYQFTEKWNVEDVIYDKASVLIRNHVLEID